MNTLEEHEVTQKRTIKLDQDTANVISEYIKIDDQLAELNKLMKELRNGKNELIDKLHSFMKKNDLTKFPIKDKIIQLKYKKKNGKVNKNTIKKALNECTISETTIEHVIEKLYVPDGDLEEIPVLVVSKKI